MKTSLIILFKNEVEYVETTLNTVYNHLLKNQIDFELIAVDDSTDGTWEILQSFRDLYPDVVNIVKGGEPSGYGKALRKGFHTATGDILIPFNGDLSDSLSDVVSYIHLIEDGYEMVFGSRFMAGSKVTNSSMIKGFVSRLGNIFIQILFRTNCNDITNSFKAYRRWVLQEINPTVAGYNIGMEIALKGIIKKYKYTTIPITWSGRQYGRSKMSVIKSIPVYLFTIAKIKFFNTG